MSRFARLRAWCGHAFAVDAPGASWRDEDRELAARLADHIVRRRLTAPALLLLECGRPLNFVGSQLLVFIRPFATLVFNPAEYERFAQMLERREGVDLLIDTIAVREEAHT